MHPSVPIPTIHLFETIDDHLISLLTSLSKEDWHLPTLASAWNVKDIVAHLLDGNIRSLSSSRDHYFAKEDVIIDGYSGLVQFINNLNQDGVRPMRRVSPEMLVELISLTNKMYRDHLAQLAPFDKAIYSVAWAGEGESQNWFHIAREYTEKWHHQQQLWYAVNRPSPLFSDELYTPYLATSFRALPYHFRNVTAQEGDTIAIQVIGVTNGTWHMTYKNKSWMLHHDHASQLLTEIDVDGQFLWRLFSKQITSDEMKAHMTIRGNDKMADVFLRMTAVMV